MYNIGTLKMHQAITIGMARPEITQADIFLSKFFTPDMGKGLIGIKLLFFVLIPAGILLVDLAVGMSQHMINQSFKSNIATTVIAMMMGIDQQFKRLAAFFLQFIDQVFGLIRELRIHDHNPVFCQMKKDGATSFGKDACIFSQHGNLPGFLEKPAKRILTG